MATVEEVVKSIAALSPTKIKQLAIAHWLNDRYRELVSKAQFEHLRKTGELVLEASVTDGTIGVTRGGTAVTGTDTTWATSPTVATHEHWYFRTRTAWYKIASVTNDTTLTLATAFSEDTVSDGSYQIVKPTHALASDARWLGTFVFPRLRYKIPTVSAAEIDIEDPGRLLAEGSPLKVAQVGVDASNLIKVEIYPPPKETELVRYSYWSLPTDLEMVSDIPPQIDQHVLKEGTLIDFYRACKVRHAEAGHVELAAFYSHEERKQATSWKGFIQDAIRTNNATDEMTFLIEGFGGTRVGGDIRTARDHVLAGWAR
jgi:hypothetical protein